MKGNSIEWNCRFSFLKFEKVTSCELKMKPNKTLEHAVKRMRASKFLGFNSISIVDGKSVTKPLDIVLLLANIFVGIFIFCFMYRQRRTLAASSSEIANFGNYIMFIALIVVAIVSMIVNFILRHRSWGIILIFVEVEKMV